ncbi:hypothetical protein N8692_03670 [Flavobacteriales bacterium]|jgi:hypothetical protein|nr:hypothetical protein [Flavobacteriales bacterium]|tara:strand:- start:493 stop:954 length:462 start_codon:yes stop_codon:yes gene_type:complete
MRLLLTILLLVLSEYTYSSDILKTRELYSNASLSENNCKKFGDSLFKNSNKSPIIKGYKGCYLMIKCKFTSNPIQKISYFKKGKSKIEKAIMESPYSLEIRLLRYSIQKKLPKILLYFNEIEEDYNFIIKNINTIKDEKTKEFIIQSLKALNK